MRTKNMNTKNIFRMLLVAATLLLGANNVKADETFTLWESPNGEAGTEMGQWVETKNLDNSLLQKITTGDEIRFYGSTISGIDSKTVALFSNNSLIIGIAYQHQAEPFVNGVATYTVSDYQEQALHNTTYPPYIVGNGVTISKIEVFHSGKAKLYLAFNETDKTVKMGETLASPTLNNTSVAVTYSSSDTSIATVNSNTGEVTPVNTGSTTIIATFAGDDIYDVATASYNLTVSKGDPNLSFTESTMSVKVGETKASPTLNNPHGLNVTYFTYNTYPVTVNSSTGAVTGVHEASDVEIHAKFDTNDNWNYSEATYKLTITAADAPSGEKSTITLNDVSLTFGNDFAISTSTAGASSLAYSFTNSSNTNVAMIVNNQIIPVGAGETTISATFEGNAQFEAYEGTFKLIVTAPTAPEGSLWEGAVWFGNWGDGVERPLLKTATYASVKKGDTMRIYLKKGPLSADSWDNTWAIQLYTPNWEALFLEKKNTNEINDGYVEIVVDEDILARLAPNNNDNCAIVNGYNVTMTAIQIIAGTTEPTEPTTATYALATNESFTSGETVYLSKDNERVASITYGETGGADFKAAAADANRIEGFAAYTEGNGTNGDKDGGTFYTIVPKYNGTISVAVALNKDKAFYILEDGSALSEYNGVTVEEKYIGTYTFSVTAGKSYKFYCSGSKLGFYGFNYTYVSTGAADPFPEETQTYTYSVTYDTYYTGGSIAVYSSGSSLSSGTEVEAGTTIYISESHESNYELSNIYVTWTGGTIYPTYSGGYYVFEMPAGNINIYASFDRIAATPQVTIGSTGYATWTPSYPIDYSPSQTPNGVTAYRAESCSNGVVTLKKITGKAEANTPVLLVATSAGTYTFTEALSGYGSVGTNLLKQGTGQIAANDRRYVLTEMGGRVVFAQLKVNGAYVSSEQAYLELPASAARTRTISFSIDDNGNGTTGINGIEENAEMENAVIYDLRGQRVDKPTKGLYIINGKKVMIK